MVIGGGILVTILVIPADHLPDPQGLIVLDRFPESRWLRWCRSGVGKELAAVAIDPAAR